ncbi:FG-GAP repeat domain-containing protein [Streptomyces sp. NPDC052396]|uniref:FG-GAP repeat domain-containing protein n=1 Tax=Streptomyces sp. NPDC052396 TaxID=3365689 RepID=UPI0037D79337
MKRAPKLAAAAVGAALHSTLRRAAMATLLTTALIGSSAAVGAEAVAAPTNTGPGTTASNDYGGAGQGPITQFGSTAQQVAPQAVISSVTAPRLTRAQVLERADSWVNAGLTYSQLDFYQGYRTDCSGYASMAWQLSDGGKKDSLDTTSFVPSGVASWIDKGDLLPGDALLNDAAGNDGHIVIFDHWADASQSSYIGYEFTRTGVHHRTIPYPYFSGYGTFNPVRNNSLVSGSAAVRFADFDGDGKADYVTVGSNGAIKVWLNKGGDGRGGWQALGQVATGATTDPSRVRFADFDGDGKADYEVINSDGSMSVWLNKGGDGHGGWQALGKVATGSATDQSRVKLADFDGDGKADYEVINSDGSMSVWLNKGGDGNGGWQALGKVATGSTTDQSRVKLADFNGDHKADYATIGSNGAINVWVNKGGDGHGGWQTLGQVGTGATTDQDDVQFADFNGDGKADYIVTDPTTNASRVYLWNGGDGNGGWTNLGQVASGVTNN